MDDHPGGQLVPQAGAYSLVRALIIAKGYRATTVARIARDAGVHVDTLYALVGRKPEILRALIERAISGSGALRPEVTVEDAADVIWATASSEFFVLLTDDRGWPLDRYQE